MGIPVPLLPVLKDIRHYLVGIDRARQTAQMRALAAIGWILGMSLSRMSIWRDIQQRADMLEKERLWKPVRVVGVDGASVRGWGKTQPI